MNTNMEMPGTTSTPTKTNRGCLWWAGRVGLGLLIAVLVVSLGGMVYQQAASARDLRNFPAPGEIVEVDGRRMHLHCTGEGSPTVVLESGAGGTSLDWALVQPEVATFARVCSYDRLGFGWSDQARGKITSEQVAKSLHELLAAAHIPGPYVLVGHSLGGLYVRTFAGLYRQDVAGLVLVDSYHEGQNLHLDPDYVQLQKNQMTITGICRPLAPFGWIRLLRVMDGFEPNPKLSVGTRQAMLAMTYRNAYCPTTYEETKLAVEHPPNQETGPPSLGELPLIVLTAGLDAEIIYADMPEAVRNMVDLDLYVESFNILRQLQGDLADLSTSSRQVIAAESHHHIQWDQPDLVVAAIRDVCQQAEDMSGG